MAQDTNQNNINLDVQRLNEIKAEKLANQKILDAIATREESLKKDKQKFETYRQEQNSLIDEKKKEVKREEDNLARKPMKVLQDAHDDLKEENAALAKQVADLSAENQELKAHVAELSK